MVKKRKTILTTGAFDIIHPGHVRMLWAAKKLGGRNARLVVVVARNETVKRNKNREPVFDEKLRRAIVENLKPVDKAILGFKPFSFEKVIKKIKPDIVVFGYDQTELRKSFEKFCRDRGLKIRIATMRKFGGKGINSSSDVFKRILEMGRRAR